MQERVAHGGDPTKLHEDPVQPDISNQEQGSICVYYCVLFTSVYLANVHIVVSNYFSHLYLQGLYFLFNNIKLLCTIDIR